jgi:hypothetical protein
VSEESIDKDLQDNLGKLYQSKSLVNKLFLIKKLYNMRMLYGESMADHLNAFNIVVIKLVYVEIKISYELSVSVYFSLYQTCGIVWLWP